MPKGLARASSGRPTGHPGYACPVSHYRDPLAGLRSQVAAKRGLVEARERGLTELLRAMLPAVLASKMGELRKRIDTGAESIEGLTTVDAALDELLSLHDQAARIAPKLRSCPDEVPDPPKSAIRPPWAIEEKEQIAFRLVLTRRLAEIEPDAWLVRWDDTTYLSRLQVGGAPVILTARFHFGSGMPTTFASTLRTSVPDVTPALEVRRAGLVDEIGRTIGLVRDDAVGDAPFDRMFIVHAPEGAPVLLTSDVRRRLVSLIDWRPRLGIDRGVVDLAWGGAYVGAAAPLWPDAAFDVVLGIRAVIERDGA